jgi:predicted AAA+ superfamily ATPase
MNNLLQSLLDEFYQKLTAFNQGTSREVVIPDVHNKISALIGMRRTGKTFLLCQVIESLLKNNVPYSRILYINFEDDRLYPVTVEKLRHLLDSFYSLFPENHEQECYLFLDEIQNAEHWPSVVRRFFDTKKVKLYITGSSAKLLSKEIATSLRGRSLSTEVWPFSFREYLSARNILLPELWSQRNIDKFQLTLIDYLHCGGFPESIHSISDPDTQRQILQEYVSVVILRDIIERHSISNPLPLRYLIKWLLKSTGSSVSVNKIYNDLKSQGFEISKTSVHEYLAHIEDAYLVFPIPLYSESVRKVQTNPKKIYAVDTGLVSACTLGFSQNTGHYFENLVYLDLRRAKHEIYYYLTKDRKEIDFLTLDPKGIWHLYQVCWDMNDKKTLDREMTALNEAENELNIKGKIITPDIYLTEFLDEIRK